MASFDLAVAKVLEHEGGYVNDPKDRGGETNFGISKRAYPNEDIKGMTRARAKEIYRRDFWAPIKGDSIADQNTATAIFDMAVNSGPSRAKKLADKAAKALGFKSAYDVPAASGAAFSNVFGRVRIEFYRALVAADPSQAKFLNGWEKRAKTFFRSNPKGTALAFGVMLATGAGAWWYFKRKRQGA